MFVVLVLSIFLLPCEFHMGYSKTITSFNNNSWDKSVSSAYENGLQRPLDNFVEFAEEGDQLAVESVPTDKANKSSNKKRKILGEKTNPSAVTNNAGRQCANVQYALYPVIPIIIAAVVGLFGSIIISKITRKIYRKKKGGHQDEAHDDLAGYGSSGGYDHLSASRSLSSLTKNVDFATLVKRVFAAIEKIY